MTKKISAVALLGISSSLRMSIITKNSLTYTKVKAEEKFHIEAKLASWKGEWLGLFISVLYLSTTIENKEILQNP